jgi:hypothetical protein
MPSIDTIVADLMNGSIDCVGQKPDSSVENARSNISLPHQLKHSAVHIKASLSGTRLICGLANRSPDFNGSYVHFEDGFATAGNMDINRTLAISGNFSGCLWRIYRAPPEGIPAGTRVHMYKCVHIARPAGPSSDAIVTMVTNYAALAGWTLIQEVPSVGFIPPQGEVMMVSRMQHNTQIDTVRLQINNQGQITGKTRFTAAI